MSAARGTSQRAERVSFPVNGGPAGLLPRLDGNMLIYMFPQGPGISEAFRSSPTPRTPSRLAASSRPRRPLRRPESRRLTATGPASPPARRPRRPTGTEPPADTRTQTRRAQLAAIAARRVRPTSAPPGADPTPAVAGGGQRVTVARARAGCCPHLDSGMPGADPTPAVAGEHGDVLGSLR
jgi:hypothetical protein